MSCLLPVEHLVSSPRTLGLGLRTSELPSHRICFWFLIFVETECAQNLGSKVLGVPCGDSWFPYQENGDFIDEDTEAQISDVICLKSQLGNDSGYQFQEL